MRISDWSSDVCSSDLVRKVSYRKLNESARALARTFIALGIKPCDNVGILLTTRPEFVELLFGIVMAGPVAVPVNARYQASELGFLVRDADLVLMVTTGRVADSLDFGERLVAALPSLRPADDPRNLRTEALRVGTEWVRSCRSRWAPD